MPGIEDQIGDDENKPRKSSRQVIEEAREGHLKAAFNLSDRAIEIGKRDPGQSVTNEDLLELYAYVSELAVGTAAVINVATRLLDEFEPDAR